MKLPIGKINTWNFYLDAVERLAENSQALSVRKLQSPTRRDNLASSLGLPLSLKEEISYFFPSNISTLKECHNQRMRSSLSASFKVYIKMALLCSREVHITFVWNSTLWIRVCGYISTNPFCWWKTDCFMYFEGKLFPEASLWETILNERIHTRMCWRVFWVGRNAKQDYFPQRNPW